ncbi:MAG: SLBB domain-containing protein, partial [Candidatus Sabulitectum sp.]|nr:SLBB domain-containing protein [Candidatus Sabulitectum sp.]
MRASILIVFTIAAMSLAVEDYSLPGINSDEILMQVNVWGEVRSPGMHLVPWDSDLRDAISAAGGPTSTADLSCVKIIFDGMDIEYDLSDYLSGNGALLPAMEPDATVYISTSSYEWWKDVVDFSYKLLVMANVILLM